MGEVIRQVVNKELIVIGAGMSGLTLALQMQNRGWNVAVFDKARGSGGRLSSKRVRSSKTEEYLSFDLGCQSFAARTAEFKEQLQIWIAEGHLEVVNAERQKRYIPVPRSSSLTRCMADKVPVSFQTRIEKVERVNKRWHCFERLPSGEYHLVAVADYLVFAIPPKQAAALLDEGHEDKSLLDAVDVKAQWVAMFRIDESIDLAKAFKGVKDSPIESVHCESSKPGRKLAEGKHTWLVHMSPTWTQRYVDADAKDVSMLIEKIIEDMVDQALQPETTFCHRWLYSQAPQPLRVPRGVLELGEGLYACGDWLVDQSCGDVALIEGVERAYMSARNLSQELSRELPKLNTQSA